MRDSKGFELHGKEPMGRCILEDWGKSGKISLWVQDLKPETTYKIVLILSEMEIYTGIIAGNLYVDNKGKGELKNEFDTSGLADGQGLLRLSAVAVLANDGNELISPLVGYKDSPVLWKNRFSFLGKGGKDEVKNARQLTRAENEVYREENTPHAAEGFPQKERQEEINTADETVSTEVNNDVTVDEHTLNYYRNERDAKEFAGIDTQEFADAQDFFGHLDNRQEETKEADIVDKPADERAPGAESSVLDYSHGDLAEIFANNIEITPFDTISQNTKWVRISLREPVFLPVSYRLLMNHPLIIAAYKKYNHMIMGCITDNYETNYVLGVPGIYEPQYISAAQQLGFTQFKTVTANVVLHPGDYGYWLTPLTKM